MGVRQSGVRQQGRRVEWKDARGFGFVVTHGTEQRIFVHIRQFAPGRTRRPREGLILVYEVRRGERAKTMADAVCFASDAKRCPLGMRRSRRGFVETFTLPFGVGLVVLVTTRKLPWQIAVTYPLLGVATWRACRKDKQTAARDRWRTRASTLPLLALLGGWPGAWLAQRHLRHQSSKFSFQLTFGFMLALNLVGLQWLVQQPPSVWAGLPWIR